MKRLVFAALVIALAALSGCGGRLTGYNLKASVGHTEYDNGSRALYTGGSVDAHFDVDQGRH